MKRGRIEIDFEFNQTAEPLLNLVCVSYTIDGGDPISIWLNGMSKDELATIGQIFYKWRKTHIFVAYGSTAEARSFMSLGLDPHDFKWIDLHAEWLQIRYNNNDFKYGRYLKENSMTADGIFKTIRILKSVAPSMDKEDNVGRDVAETGRGYAGCVCALFGEIIDTIHKTKMRDLIISNPAEYTKKQKRDIIEYCESDLIYLHRIRKRIVSVLRELTGVSKKEVRKWQINRGKYSACCAKMEAHGIPIDIEAVTNLGRNNWNAVNELVTALNEHYVFYEKDWDNKKDLKGYWVLKQVLFENWIKENGYADVWPYTKTSKIQLKQYEDDGEYWKGKKLIEGTPPVPRFSGEDAVLKSFRGIDIIDKLRETKKSINNLNWFRKDAVDGSKGEKGFLDYVGSDGRLRAYFGPFGTQTGRNAPPAKRFPFAMSKWLRCIMKADEGISFTEVDYSNQEFILGAYKADDVNMIEAYDSGDPYMFFAIEAKGAPEGANKETHPEPRKKFKSTVLGLQYFMGIEKLTTKLRADTGDPDIDEGDATVLRQLHRDLFSDFWTWVKEIQVTYEEEECLILPDGWLLGPHCGNRIPSICNFPVQGLGACIIREACYLSLKRGVGILAPVHDAIYIMHKTGDTEAINIVVECMAQAVENIVPGCKIRVDINTHVGGKVWVHEDGKETYERLKQYLEYHDTDEQVLEHIVDLLYPKPKQAKKVLKRILSM